MNKSLFSLISILIPLIMAGQGYYNQENFGNRSILLGGNVTGSVDDLGFTFYNPARIALIDEPVFTINAKAYQFGSLKLKNIFGRDEKLSDSKFEGVPSLLAGTFNLGDSDKHKFAYAFLTKQRSRVDIGVTRENVSGGLVDDIEEVDKLAANIEMNNRETDEWFGGSWGTKLADNLSIGVSAFVSVYDFSGLYDVRYARLEVNQEVDFYNNVIKFSQKSYGMFWKVGLAWQLKNIDLGVNIDAPYLEIIKNGSFRYYEFFAGMGPDDDIYQYINWNDIESKRKEPLGISVGAGFPLGKNKIHVKVDWHGKVSEYDRLVIPIEENGNGDPLVFSFKDELKSVINFGLGAEIYLSEKWNLYAGFSTDFSPEETNANIFDLIGAGERDTNLAADYYHYSFGVQLKLKNAQLVIGSTYSSATTTFDRPVDFPDPDDEITESDDPSSLGVSRWRFILGLEIPIFGRKVEFK